MGDFQVDTLQETVSLMCDGSATSEPIVAPEVVESENEQPPSLPPFSMISL